MRLSQIFAAAAASGFPDVRGINLSRVSLCRADLSASRSASSETSFPQRKDQSVVSCPTFRDRRPAALLLTSNEDPDRLTLWCKIHLKITRQSGLALGNIITRVEPVASSWVCLRLQFSFCFLLFFFFRETQSVINNKKEGDNYKPTMCRSS